jgi:hypothetical protein
MNAFNETVTEKLTQALFPFSSKTGIVMARLKSHPNILRLHAMAFAGSPGE